MDEILQLFSRNIHFHHAYTLCHAAICGNQVLVGTKFWARWRGREQTWEIVMPLFWFIVDVDFSRCCGLMPPFIRLFKLYIRMFYACHSEETQKRTVTAIFHQHKNTHQYCLTQFGRLQIIMKYFVLTTINLFIRVICYDRPACYGTTWFCRSRDEETILCAYWFIAQFNCNHELIVAAHEVHCAAMQLINTHGQIWIHRSLP